MQEPFIDRGGAFSGGGDPQRRADHLRQGDQPLKGLPARRFGSLRAVGELFHAVQHAGGHALAAHGAKPVCPLRFRRRKTDVAGAVAVEVVLPLLRKKFDRPGKAVLLAAQRCGNRRIGQRAGEQVRFTAELLRGMCVGVGNEQESVERGKPPVHRRIGGQARFQRMDIRREILKAFLNRIEPGKCPEQRKVGRPDMRGDEHGVRRGLEGDFQQIAAVQTENGTAVGMDIPDRFQTQGQLLRRLQAGEQDQVMHLADASVLFVDGADFARHDEPRPAVVMRTAVLTQLLPENIKPLLGGRLEPLCQHFPPGRVREVPRSQQGDPFPARPEIQRFRDTVRACGARIFRMNVEITNYHKIPPFSRGRAAPYVLRLLKKAPVSTVRNSSLRAGAETGSGDKSPDGCRVVNPAAGLRG